MSYNEDVILELKKIMVEESCDMIEACGMFCELHDMDEAYFIKTLDSNVIEMLKSNAIENKRVRKCVATENTGLF